MATVPRPLEIIREINAWFLARSSALAGRHERRERMSIITGGDFPVVRMAYLATSAARVNGVAELHTELLNRVCFAIFTNWPQIRQRNQRRHPEALACALQSGAPDSAKPSATADSRPGQLKN